MPLRSMIHTNHSLMAAIRIETTGPIPRFHDIIEICILILDSTFSPMKNMAPFYTQFHPRRPENTDFEEMRMKPIRYYKLLQSALDADRAADLFDEWFKYLNMPYDKKLMVLSHEWVKVHPFLEDWLGFHHMKHYFHPQVRDLQTSAILENDKADFQVEPYPFAKTYFQYMCKTLRVDLFRPYDVLQECAAMGEAYKRLLRSGAEVLKVHEDPDQGPKLEEINPQRLGIDFQLSEIKEKK